jgi:hypothetical protein
MHRGATALPEERQLGHGYGPDADEDLSPPGTSQVIGLVTYNLRS